MRQVPRVVRELVRVRRTTGAATRGEQRAVDEESVARGESGGERGLLLLLEPTRVLTHLLARLTRELAARAARAARTGRHGAERRVLWGA